MNHSVLLFPDTRWITPVLDKVLADAGLVARKRSADGLAWESVSACLAYLPVDYSAAMIDYQIAYWSGNNLPTVDISMILIHDNRPCALWPLSLSREQQGNWRIGTNGVAIDPPLFVTGLAPKTIKSLTVKCLAFLDDICKCLEQSRFDSVESYIASDRMSEWHDRAMHGGAGCMLQHEMYVDLSPELAQIKSSFRKSYKALVSSGTRLWQVFVLDGEGDGIWEEYRLLHLAVAGRATRSLESWDRQYQAICSRQAFLVYLRDTSGRMVGGGLFHTTKDEALYAVGAYDRDLFDKPLGHVVQYRAIEEMKKRGMRWYKLGTRPYPSDDPAPSEKELAIADFKQGFSSHIFPRYVIHHCLPEATQSSPVS